MKKNITYSTGILFALFLGTNMLMAQAPIQEFKFNQSYSSEGGTASFTSNAGSSFVSDRFGTANAAVNINNTGLVATINNLPYGNAARSFSLWVKVNVFLDPTFNFLYSYGSPGPGTANGASISANNTFHLGFFQNHNVTDANQVNIWNHYVFSFDGTTSRIYKNGNLIGTANFGWNTLNNNNLFRLGIGVGNEIIFNGAIDDLKIYNRAISLTEVQQEFSPSVSGSVHEFQFNGSLSNLANTASFSSNAGLTYVPDRFGIANRALNIQGTGTTATLPSLNYGNNPRSISFWVKLNRFTNPNFNFLYNYGNTNGVIMTETGFTHFNSNNNNHISQSLNLVNQWYHLVITYDGTTSRIYKSGQLISSSTTNFNFTNNNDLFRLGLTESGGTFLFDGAIDDLVLYNKALTQNEVNTIANPSNFPPIIPQLALPSTDLLWTFNGRYTTTLNAFPFSNPNGTFLGTDRQNEPNSTLNLSNSGSIATGVNLLPVGNAPRTVTFWFRPSSSNFQELFVWGTGGNNTTYGLSLTSNGIFNNYRSLLGSGFYTILTSTSPQTNLQNVWNFIAVVYTGSSASIYRNGAKISETAITTPIATTGTNLSLGRDLGSVNNPFIGSIDDFTVYNTALSQNEIAGIFFAQSLLPLTLTRFNGNMEKGMAKLNWETSQEQNTSHFEIEHSTLGDQFTKVAQVQASENSSTTRNYTLEHKPFKNPLHFYRLKMVDKDGAFTYSQVLKLEDNHSGEEITLYPTVTSNRTTLSIISKEKQRANISLISTSGQVLKQYSITLQQGTNTQTIALDNMAAGYYLIQVKNEKETKILKVIKQ